MQKQSRQDLEIQFFQHVKGSAYIMKSIGKALVGLSASQKNANSQLHLPLLIGLQHPGGALRTGQDGQFEELEG